MRPMRASSLTSRLSLAAITLAALSLVACGAKPKQVGDPSSENTPSNNDETPKWDSTTTRPPPEDPNKPKVQGVQEAPTRRTDVYDKEATEIALKRAARQVKDNCGAAKDDGGKASGPWGKATIQVQLGRNGHSKGITVPAPYQGKPVGNCVEKAFTNLTFPPWGGEDTQVDWDIELVNPAAPPAK
jgi:hypothetical protein